MTATATPLNSDALAFHLADQLGKGRRVLVVVDRDWRDELEIELLRHPNARVIRHSTGYHRVERVAAAGALSLITERAALGGAGRGLQVDELVLPLDVDERILVMLVPVAYGAGGTLLRHTVGR